GAQHGRRSILAALNIRQAVTEMNNAGMFAFPVHIGIGITSGGLVLGDIGSEHRKERTPLGPVVNMASRLCSAAGAGEIIVSESTRGNAGRGFRLGSGEHLQLKGFPTEQLVYQVLDLLPGASGTHDALPPLRS
nr:adenylate/guanylate cyclase domain-containing protein [Deltaproteobacteria bacterium]